MAIAFKMFSVFTDKSTQDHFQQVSGSFIMQDKNQKAKSAKAKKKVIKQGKNAENVFYESSSQERLTVEATDFKEFF